MERTRSAIARALVVLLALVLTVAACSSNDGDDASTASADDSGDSQASTGGEVAASADSAGGGGEGGVDGVTDVDVELLGAEIDRKIVYRGDIAAEVDDVVSAVRSARDEVAAEGGFVFGQEISGDTARVVLKVPSIRFDAAFDAVTSIGEVTSQSIEADDVTEQFTDLESRRNTLESSIVRLRGFLDAAANADEVSRLESELTRREAERDVIAGQLRVLEDRTTFGTITAVFTTPPDATAVTEGDDDDAALPGFGRGLEVGVDGVIVLASIVATVSGFALPFLPVIAVVAALVWWQRRRRAEIFSAPEDRPSPA